MDVRKIFTQNEEICQKSQPFLPSKEASISGKNQGTQSLQSIGLAYRV
jgi:hypothetical protein